MGAFPNLNLSRALSKARRPSKNQAIRAHARRSLIPITVQSLEKPNTFNRRDEEAWPGHKRLPGTKRGNLKTDGRVARNRSE